MSNPSFDEIKTSTEKAVGFIEWFAEVLRGKYWVTKLLLLDVIIFTIFNPLFFPTILKLFVDEPTLPNNYKIYFWAVIIIIAIITLIIAVRTRPQKAKSAILDLSMRSAIKGLRPFGFEDAEIFAQLQRELSIRECYESITESDFRFGVLCGELGCGKTSFLQAGLIPRIKDHHQCVYVKFTDLDPLESIRQALIEQTKLPKERAEAEDFLSLLETTIAENSKTLILFFDQFEQFFVHHKIKEQREPLIKALSAWYKNKQQLPVKIFICMRGDFSDRLIELQKAMEYSLGPQDSIRLEKLTPDEAAEIFRVIAETEGISCDADFMKELTKQELAREDGLISPVDIQILAWMIRGQKSAEERAFNRHTFQQLGGIEGLLERFLSRVLDVRETEERRQTAIKVLLALTNLERNVRAGVLTLENLQNKLAGSVPENELTETVQWLARGDVRLITPNKLEGTLGYELAHERLIPALRKVANKTLTGADQANQLLNRRVNEWLANDLSSRYLLNWLELRQIKQQEYCLVWGHQRNHKENLISLSRKRFGLKVSTFCVILLLAIGIMIFQYSAIGQIWRIKKNLSGLVLNIDDNTKRDIVSKFSQVNNCQIALQITKDIKDPYFKISALNIIGEAYNRNGDINKAKILLQEAISKSNAISDPSLKARSLVAIADACRSIGDINQGKIFLQQAFLTFDAISDTESNAIVLGDIAEAYVNIGDTNNVVEVLHQALQVAGRILDPVCKESSLSAIAKSIVNVEDTSQRKELMQETLKIAQDILDPDAKGVAMINITEALVQIGWNDVATSFWQKQLQIAETITDPFQKFFAFKKLVIAYIKIGEKKQTEILIQKAIEIVDSIIDPNSKFIALFEVTYLIEEIGKNKLSAKRLQQIISITESLPDTLAKSRVLYKIAETTANIEDNKQPVTLLQQALLLSEGITDPYFRDYFTYCFFNEIEKFRNRDEATNWRFQKAISLSKAITDPDLKANILMPIVVSSAKAER